MSSSSFVHDTCFMYFEILTLASEKIPFPPDHFWSLKIMFPSADRVLSQTQEGSVSIHPFTDMKIERIVTLHYFLTLCFK